MLYNDVQIVPVNKVSVLLCYKKVDNVLLLCFGSLHVLLSLCFILYGITRSLINT